MLQAQMIELALKKEVTELHDISWESTQMVSKLVNYRVISLLYITKVPCILLILGAPINAHQVAHK